DHRAPVQRARGAGDGPRAPRRPRPRPGEGDARVLRDDRRQRAADDAGLEAHHRRGLEEDLRRRDLRRVGARVLRQRRLRRGSQGLHGKETARLQGPLIRKTSRRMTMRITTGICALLFAAAAAAQYPNKPITTVVGFAPGGGTDTVSRIVAKTLGEQLGQQVLTDNKAGAGGNIATDYVVRAAPDGYTIYLANVGAIAVNPHLLQLAYDPLTDLAPITMAVVFPNLVVVHPRVPANTLAEFIKLAKDNPGKYSYGSSGIGGAGHLAGELLKMMAHIDIVHVPFKGGGPAMQGMLGGQIDAYMATPVAAGPHVKAGKVKALATTGAKRDPFMSDVPTVAEVCCPGYEATNWYAYYAPAKTPKEIISRLNREITKALHSEEVKGLLAKQSLEAAPGTPEQLADYSKREYETWGKVVKQAGIKAQ